MAFIQRFKRGTSSTNISGTKEDVHQAVMEKEYPLRFVALPNWFHEAQMATSNAAATKDDAIPDNNAPQKEQEEVNEDKEVPEIGGNSNPIASTKVSTNDLFELASSLTVETKVPTLSTPVPTGSLYVPLVTSSVLRIISRGGSSHPEGLSLGNAMSFENRLEDFFGDTSDVVSLNDVEADLSNMKNAFQVTPTLTLIIHKDHPKSQIIGHVDTPVQTRQKTKKKDERGIVIRNKARLVAQGHTQEEGINYEEVFAPVAKIKAIRLFLAYASYMGFIVYQMDVKSAFLYGTIDEEGGDSGNSANGVNKDPVVNMCLNFLHGSDSEQWTYEFMHIYLVSASVCVCMDRLAFCDYHNMVAILEKTEHNTDFYQIVDFLEASHIRYALTVRPTVYVSHIRQFWSTARVETTDEETKILAKVNGRQMTISESSIRRHLKLNDEEDETAFLTGDVRYGEAFFTIPSLDAGQDRVQSQDLKITQLKTRVKTLKDNEKRREGLAQEDAPNTKGDQGEDLLVGDTVKDSDKSADKGSDSTDEMTNVLGTLGATNILASGGLRSVFTTASLSVTTASTFVSLAVATTSESFPTVVIFTTTNVATPTTRGYSQAIRPFNKYSAYKKTIFNKERNPYQKEYKEKGVIDSGCSRHMTGNKCYLTDYEDYDGGFVPLEMVKVEYLEKIFLVFFLATKDEPSGILKTFITGIENQLDWIKREFSVDGTPQQNGVAKRKNRTLIKAARTMALVIKPHNKTPYELIGGRPLLIDFMIPFGCLVTILNTRDYLGKFDEKANEGFFLGYSMVIVAGFQTNGIAGTKDNIVAGQAKMKKEHEQEYILIPICTTDPLLF
nr:copia protein [Tanacetum cinerariifolium]